MQQIRRLHFDRVHALLHQFPAVALIGARQTGKTTLARQVAREWPGPVHAFDLEDDRDLARLEDPMLALAGLQGLVILDEIQRRPDLFPTLRVLCDREDRPARFLVLGSAAAALLQQSSESLAGRLAYHTIEGFSLPELGVGALDDLWLRGGFPLSVLASTDADAAVWRGQFVRTFVERDLPQFGLHLPSVTMRRFWTMLAHWHGGVWNGAEFARAFGIGEHAVRRYLDALAATFVVRVVQPWHENLAKRQVRSPKVYVADSGLLHALLDVRDREGLLSHPKVGASWEGFLLGQIAAILELAPESTWFWATHSGAELDLLAVSGARRLGFEFKRSSAPTLTPSMRIALRDLRLDRLDVVHAGEGTWPMAERIRAVAARDLLAEHAAGRLA